MSNRDCSKPSCSKPAVATLTFVYADSTAVLGPLSAQSEPHSYDLCVAHAAGFTAPKGWNVITVPASPHAAVDDVVALARAVAPREESTQQASFSQLDEGTSNSQHTQSGPAKRRHLTVMRSSETNDQ